MVKVDGFRNTPQSVGCGPSRTLTFQCARAHEFQLLVRSGAYCGFWPAMAHMLLLVLYPLGTAVASTLAKWIARPRPCASSPLDATAAWQRVSYVPRQRCEPADLGSRNVPQALACALYVGQYEADGPRQGQGGVTSDKTKALVVRCHAMLWGLGPPVVEV